MPNHQTSVTRVNNSSTSNTSSHDTATYIKEENLKALQRLLATRQRHDETMAPLWACRSLTYLKIERDGNGTPSTGHPLYPLFKALNDIIGAAVVIENIDEFKKSSKTLEQTIMNNFNKVATTNATKGTLKSSNEIKISSREIARLTEKEHKEVLRDIRKMETSWIRETAQNDTQLSEVHRQGNFAQSSYRNKQGKSQPEYLLTASQYLFVITKYNDQHRARLVLNFEKLLKQNQQPQQVLLPARVTTLLSRNNQQKETIKQLKAKLSKIPMNELATAHRDCTVKELAAAIRRNGYIISAEGLYDYLRRKNYLSCGTQTYNTPMHTEASKQFFKVEETMKTTKNGVRTIRYETLVTPVGQIYFLSRLKKD